MKSGFLARTLHGISVSIESGHESQSSRVEESGRGARDTRAMRA
jgi:hypothetical protein